MTRDEHRDALLENLTSVQERCNTLLEESRAARAETRRIQAMADAMSRAMSDADRQRPDVHDDECDVCRGTVRPENARTTFCRAHVQMRGNDAIPRPHVTMSAGDGELCFEWWRGDEKRTLYAKPGDIFKVGANGNAQDTNVAELLAWLRLDRRPDAKTVLLEARVRELEEAIGVMVPTALRSFIQVATGELDRSLTWQVLKRVNDAMGELTDPLDTMRSDKAPLDMPCKQPKSDDSACECCQMRWGRAYVQTSGPETASGSGLAKAARDAAAFIRQAAATYNVPFPASLIDDLEGTSGGERASGSPSCHKCKRSFPEVSMINDGEDHDGPPVCVDCHTAGPAISDNASPSCVTPNGRTDGHGSYGEMVNGTMVCTFCKRPIEPEPTASGGAR